MGNKIYTAGFDIFLPDALSHMENIRQLCIRYGFEPLFQSVKSSNGVKPTAHEIFNKNVAMIDASDIVAANLNNFRGLEMDSGTAFEIGYAYAKNKILYGYMDDIRPMIEKFGAETDPEGCSVENFSLPINLMIGCRVKIVKGTLEDCLKVILENQ